MKQIELQRTRRMDMMHGSLLKKILLFALPLAASSILQQLFNAVDVAVVGRFASSQALAAVGSNSSVISLMINLFVGISVGANVLIARYIGQQNERRIRSSVHTVMVIALVSGALLLVVGLFIAKPILEWMNTPSDVIELAVLYLRIYFLGMPFIMIYDFGAAILRSTGDTKRPLYCLILSGIINAALNLLLVAVFHLSVAGVAIATVVSNIISAGLVLLFLLREQEPIRLHPSRLSVNGQELKRVLSIGVPAGIQGVVFSLANVCIQTSINAFGADAVAGSATALNYEYFAYFLVSAFAQATVTFVSQNYGAGNLDRCKKTFWISMAASILSCGLLCVVFVLGQSFFIRLFTTDTAVFHYASLRMQYVLVLEFLCSSYEIGGAALRGLGYSMTPAMLTVLGSCVLRLVWIVTVCRYWQSYVVLLLVYPISWAVTGLAVLIAYYRVQKRLLTPKAAPKAAQ